MTDPAVPPPQRLTLTHWLIVSIAALGFAFDIYELLVMPLVARPALAELLQVDPNTASGNAAILTWTSYILLGSAFGGGLFGLVGGYLTDRLGRRTVLTYSILLYAFAALASGFVTSPVQLLVCRVLVFIGVCVEFVAAVAWLAELFPNPHQRETVLGYTQAFSSVGGLLVTVANIAAIRYAADLPEIYGKHEPWRYTLISGLIPAIPLILIRPFLPESPVWQQKREAGTLKRPSFGELFAPHLRRVTLTTTILFACGYGAAFGAIQLTPQIVPGLVPELPKINKLRADYQKAKEEGDEAAAKALLPEIGRLGKLQQETAANVQLWQELGGLAGRFALAILAVSVVSRRRLLRLFQVPGLLIIPLVFFVAAAGHLGENSLPALKIGIFVAGFLTVAQFSFWGNYLPQVYPVHLRGTGESFAANVGGRLLGTAFNPVAIFLATTVFAVASVAPPTRTAYAAGTVALFVYLVGVVVRSFLPEPSEVKQE